MSVRPLLLVVVCGLAAAACRGPADPVAELLAELERAVEARDAEALSARLAADFEGRDGMSRDRALETARRLLLGYQEATLEIYEVVQEPTEAGARVRFWAEFSGRARRLGGLAGLLPPGAVYLFELELRRGQPWLVVSARWEQRAGPGDAAGGVSSGAEGGAR